MTLRTILPTHAMRGTAFLLTFYLGFLAGEAAGDPFAGDRARMVERDMKARGITDPKVLEVMGRVPRHQFVLPGDRHRAYGDHPLPIGEGQTISQPYIVAYMTEAVRLKPGEKVLEIGTGSGYQAAVLAELTDRVYTIEIREGLARRATARLHALGYSKVRVRHGNGYYGWPEHAPYDVIMVTAAANHIPPDLIKQLKPGGRLILPLGGTTYFQTLTLVRKDAKEETSVEHLLSVRFVPLVGGPER